MAIWENKDVTVLSFKRMKLDNQEIQVRLDRADVHNILTDVTNLVVANGATSAAPVVPVTANRRVANNATFTAHQVNVSKPSTIHQWLTELRTNAAATPTASKYYQFGNWVIELDHGDGYYMEVYGSVGANQTFGQWNTTSNRWVLGSTYDAMRTNGHFDATVAAHQIRTWLSGADIGLVNPGTANVALAMFVSESTRNFRTWLVNLMGLDLIQAGKLTWDRFLTYHPMARGGTYTPGVTGMLGGAKDPETARYEINVTMDWLAARSLPRLFIWNEDGAAPAQPADHVAAARSNLKGLLLERARKLRKM